VASCKPTSPELSDDKNASAEARSLHSIRSLSVNMLAPEPTNENKREVVQAPRLGPNPTGKMLVETFQGAAHTYHSSLDQKK